MPAMLIGTIDFYHFIPLLLTLTLPGGNKVSTKQNLFWLQFLALFSSDQDEILCDKTVQADYSETTF